MDTARLVLLDAESEDALHSLREEDLSARVPRGLRALPALRLSGFGAPPVIRHGTGARAVDWDGLGAAVMRLVEAAREQGRSGPPPVHTLVGGLGPLPVFVLAGCELSAWIGNVSFVNRRKSSFWDELTLDASAAPADTGPFDLVRGLPAEPSPSAGLVAVAITTRGAPADREAMLAFCRETGHDPAGVVEIRSSRPLALEAGNARAAFAQIEQTLSVLHGFFPRRHGLALFVDGPASLGFLAGRAVNPNVHCNVYVPNYASGRAAYEPAFLLPWGSDVKSGAPSGAPGEPVTALFVAANPEDEERLALEEEARDIRQKIRAAQYRDALRLETRWAVRPDDLLQAFNELRPGILHFSGHGQATGIVLQGDDGAPRVVSREALVRLCRVFADPLHLVVLSACFSEEQAAAITEVVDCAVGMTGAVDDEAARVFTASFYSALCFGHSVQKAFDQGVLALDVEDLADMAAPRLLARRGVDPARVFPLAAARPDRRP